MIVDWFGIIMIQEGRGAGRGRHRERKGGKEETEEEERERRGGEEKKGQHLEETDQPWDYQTVRRLVNKLSDRYEPSLTENMLEGSNYISSAACLTFFCFFYCFYCCFFYYFYYYY
jgi:hypothetical protein